MFDEEGLGRLMVAEVDSGERPSTVVDVGKAITTGRRQRRVRHGLVAAGVLGLVAAAVAVVPTLAPRPVAPAAAPEGYVVTAVSTIRDPVAQANTEPGFDPLSWAHNYSLLLDPTTGRYERVPYTVVIPSPDGRRTLVWQGDNSEKYPQRVGVLDRNAAQPRWLTADGSSFAGASEGVWSPDGRRILFTTSRWKTAGGPGVVVVDADTLVSTFVPVPEIEDGNANGLEAVWTPDGTGFVLALTTLRDNTGVTLSAIATWDLTGKARGTVPVGLPADVEASEFFFSADRMRLAVTTRDGAVLIDTTSGAVVRTVLGSDGSHPIGWRDDGHLMTVTTDRESSPRHVLQVVDLDGRVVRTVPLPESGQRYRVGPIDGLPGNVETF